MRSFLLFISCGILISTSAQVTQVGKTANAIDRLISRYHYEPKALDDSLSSYLFHQFLETIDPTGYYFLKSDIETLRQYEFQIDNQIQAKTSEFFDEVADIYLKRLNQSDSIITHLLDQGFNFDEQEKIDYRIEEAVYLDNHVQLSQRWKKWLKASILEELFEGYYLDDPLNTTIDSLKMKIPDALKEVRDYEKFEITSFTKHPAGYKSFLATFFLEALASYYDPHTSYFSDIEKENFEAELSKDNYAYGFSLKEDEFGRIQIAGLTPGGAAWMSNAINKDDIILEVQFENGKAIDVTKLSLEQLMLVFDSQNSKTVIMKLEKANGRVEEVSLTKTEIYVDEDVIKSVILSGEKKIGYITLPDFYTDWDDNTGLGCANDVAKNIVKLKQENIDGLILDLRNNGGGSLKEALDLAGIFIDYGPIAIEQDKQREPRSLKDMNKGAIYDGPLVILVNGLSASASEIFSASMQDYNRAIIVGSQTYGKSTGQVVLPLDPAFNMAIGNWQDASSDYGFLKVTTSKYYRITNETHQKEGVVPNVSLRDYYELYEYKESLNKMALDKDKVEKKVYYTPFPEFPVSKLQSNSRFRMEQNIFYQELCSVLDSIHNFTDYYEVVPLNLAEYQQNEKKMEGLYDQLFSEELEATKDFSVINNQFDAAIMKMNAYRSELNEDYLKIVAKDMYIGEAYHVLLDYINSK